MPDYKKMYAILCGAASDALDVLPETEENAAGRALLQRALDKAEELYIDEEERDKAPLCKGSCRRR